MASYPTFDPNNLATASGNLDNRAFDEVYEPGSTGKVITASAALEEGVATPDTPVTVPNTLKRAGTVFHDSHDHATEHLTFAGVLAQSSNIGTMLVGEKLLAGRPCTATCASSASARSRASASPARPPGSSRSRPTGAGPSATR